MIIATRILRLSIGEKTLPLAIRMFAPEPADHSWLCRYEIDWPDRPKISAGHGVDGFQAIQLTMQKIGIELYTSQYHSSGALVFEKPNDGYGFPISKHMRDMLVGEDAAQFGP